MSKKVKTDKAVKTYDDDSIVALKGAERVRKRPAVIFGSDGLEGCQHAIFEIIANSTDEAREGHGNVIEVTRHGDLSVTIRDEGRGVPVDFNKAENAYNWELLFCELYAGGKYDNNDENSSYKYSLGLNGLGLCSAQYSSEYMDVIILRDGYEYKLHFEKGENIGGLQKEKYDGGLTGTLIHWRPDREVFNDIDVSLDWYKDTLKRQAVVNAGVTYILIDDVNNERLELKYEPSTLGMKVLDSDAGEDLSDTLEPDDTDVSEVADDETEGPDEGPNESSEPVRRFEFFYENGVRDYIKELANGTNFTEVAVLNCSTQGKDRDDKDEYKLKFEVGFCFSNTVNKLEYYHNSSWLEYGGAPDKAVKVAFVTAVDGWLRANEAYKKDEKRITFSDIEESLILVTNSFSTETSYENQTKKAINNKFIQDAMSEFLRKQLPIYFTENKPDADKVTNQVIVNKRSRETAERARVAVKKNLTNSVDLNNRVDKFVNCRTKDTTRRELYIVEGDSALGSCKLGRDAEFQAIMPVRGKIFNCLKADYAKILKNEIITDLVRVLGCGIELAHSKASGVADFDLNKLNWSKVIICTDADYDGYHIRTLILTMLYRLMPTLIDKGKVFIAESPLYEITVGKKALFAYNEQEKEAILGEAAEQGVKAKLQRSKGLGENEPEMMWQTTMNPRTRRLIQVMPDDVQATQDKFELLLGDNLKGRKEFIADIGHKYIDTVEVV